MPHALQFLVLTLAGWLNRHQKDLIDSLREENPSWGYTRIRGALANFGHEMARSTVKRILQYHGIEPAPERSRRTAWKTFLQAHWEGLAAADLFTMEVLTLGELRRYFVLFVLELKTRRGKIVGIHHRRRIRTPRFNGVNVSVDSSTATIARPHESSAHLSHSTGHSAQQVARDLVCRDDGPTAFVRLCSS